MGQLEPRERLLVRGAQALTDAELLAVVLETEVPGSGVAERLLSASGGLMGLVSADRWSLRRAGAGEGLASIVLATAELLRRLGRAKIASRPLFDRPQEVATYIEMRSLAQDQEVLGALFLDVQHRLVAEREIFRGCLSRLSVEPRQVLREALQSRAAGIILWHNHTSGDPEPSPEDLLFTQRMAEASELVGIRLIDHLILGQGQWVSLSRCGIW